jgi:hypothetical protein
VRLVTIFLLLILLLSLFLGCDPRAQQPGSRAAALRV